MGHQPILYMAKTKLGIILLWKDFYKVKNMIKSTQKTKKIKECHKRTSNYTDKHNNFSHHSLLGKYSHITACGSILFLKKLYLLWSQLYLFFTDNFSNIKLLNFTYDHLLKFKEE